MFLTGIFRGSVVWLWCNERGGDGVLKLYFCKQKIVFCLLGYFSLWASIGYCVVIVVLYTFNEGK